MIQMFHTSWPELWLNPRVGQPPAFVVLRGGPDGHQESHADGGRSGADLEPTSGFDLLNRLLAGKLRAVGGSIRADVGGPVINDLRHLGPLLRVGSHRIPLIARISPLHRMTGGTARPCRAICHLPTDEWPKMGTGLRALHRSGWFMRRADSVVVGHM